MVINHRRALHFLKVPLLLYRGEFWPICLVHNVKKIAKKMLGGIVSLPERYSRLFEEAMPEYREEQLALVGAEA